MHEYVTQVISSADALFDAGMSPMHEAYMLASWLR